MTSKNLKNVNDAKLLLLVKSGNEMAFNMLYDRYWKRLFAYTYNILNDKGLAEDVLHEIFTTIWAKKEILEINSLENYLFVSAKNKSISFFRKMKFTELDDTIIENLSFEPAAENTLDAIDVKHTLENATKNLPNRCKEIFFMSRYDDFTNEEIANHFKISQRTVENQLYLALKHLRSTLKKGVSFLFFF